MIRLATVFSGIGAIEHALDRLNLKYKIVFACDNGDVDVFGKKIKPTVDDIKENIIDLQSLLQKYNLPNGMKEDLLKILNQQINILNEKLLTQKMDKKSLQDIADKLGMIYERLNTFNTNLKFSKIKSYVGKKKYIDSLYISKEKYNKVKKSYMANYNVTDKDFHWNICFLDGNQYKGKVDLFVGGSPCQSFSLVGKQRGLEDTRGTLFYEFARLIKEIQPKVFIYENVKAILSNDHGKTWKTIKRVFDQLGYDWHQSVLNAKDYGVPQNRERNFVVGFRKDLKLKDDFLFPEKVVLKKTMQDLLLENAPGKYYLSQKGVDFVLDEKNLMKRFTQVDGNISLCQTKNQQFNWHGDFVFVEDGTIDPENIIDLERYYLSEKVEKYVLSSGTKGFYSKPQTDLKVARPLLTTMHKMHRAGVDNYVTTKGRLRKLTPRECLRLMGFTDDFRIVVSDTAMYQQAGNSIVVDVLMAIMKSILKVYKF